MELPSAQGELTLRKTLPSDFGSIKERLRPFDASSIGQFEEFLLTTEVPGIDTMTLTHGDEVVCIAIVWPIRKGVAEIAVATTDLVVVHKSDFCRTAQVVTDYYTSKLNRLQCFVRSDHFVSQKWVERMGFKFEGEARKYFSGGYDALMYSRVGGK